MKYENKKLTKVINNLNCTIKTFVGNQPTPPDLHLRWQYKSTCLLGEVDKVNWLIWLKSNLTLLFEFCTRNLMMMMFSCSLSIDVCVCVGLWLQSHVYWLDRCLVVEWWNPKSHGQEAIIHVNPGEHSQQNLMPPVLLLYCGSLFPFLFLIIIIIIGATFFNLF